MRICLQNEEVVLSWQISNIHIFESQLRFNVSGFNYRGPILIEYTSSQLIIYSVYGYIKTASTGIEALSILDSYIEKNIEAYNSLLDFWGM